MKIPNTKRHITRRGVIKNNPPAKNVITGLCSTCRQERELEARQGDFYCKVCEGINERNSERNYRENREDRESHVDPEDVFSYKLIDVPLPKYSYIVYSMRVGYDNNKNKEKTTFKKDVTGSKLRDIIPKIIRYKRANGYGRIDFEGVYLVERHREDYEVEENFSEKPFVSSHRLEQFAERLALSKYL